MEHQKEELAEPVSPVGQYFNSSVLCIYIIGVLEFEVPIDDLQTYALLQDVFLPINPRFSSIMVLSFSSLLHCFTYFHVHVMCKNITIYYTYQVYLSSFLKFALITWLPGSR